jgi:Spy/CpxP family protein refolding chaperone
MSASYRNLPQSGDPAARQFVGTLISIGTLVSHFIVAGAQMSTVSCFRRAGASRSRFLAAAVAGIASLTAILAASSTSADPVRPIVNEKFSDFAPAIAELRQEAGQDRRNIVKANMLLTETEGARFWPLYDEYRSERQKIGDRRLRLITDFLADEHSMSEDEARTLANEEFAIEKDTGELKAKWYKKMTKVLSERTVARFFHIDGKLDAAADFARAVTIPLIH